jgi:D-amino-acid oxidase
MQEKEAVVLGAGVIGLSTAIELLRRGWEVTVVAKAFSPHTVSDKAGAIWFPYNVYPHSQAVAWSRASYQRLQPLAEQPGTGVSMVRFTVMERAASQEAPWWREALPPDAYEREDLDPEASDGRSVAHWLWVPFMDPAPYMSYLASWAQRLGARMRQEEVGDLEAYAKKLGGKTLVNCTGLGARTLAHDEGVFPTQGQMLVLERPATPLYRKADDGPQSPTYVFTRGNTLVMGGTAIPEAWGTQPSEQAAADIRARGQRLAPETAGLQVLGQYVGLRPSRAAIRLERDPNIANLVHNYGHGGGGYTASWGCALAVANLLEPTGGR